MRTALAILILMSFGLGCAGGSGRIGEEKPGLDSLPSVKADAYLYDLRIWRDGKPTSIRLELFDADSVIALNGRAYLGKGALSGLMTSDSLLLYFPSRNEYVAETLDEAAGAEGCGAAISQLRIGQFLTELPDSSSMPDSVRFERIGDDENRPEFLLSHRSCKWQLRLLYDRDKQAHTLQRLEFDDGASLRITAARREVKRDKEIPGRKFRLQIPEEAVQIRP